jgi:RHH-type transcriptional regulator, proline utilization regulon repressor / proline dehydrogenase / delta 1-pyrroline-5-carboxylate dehydrogenase
MAGIDPKTLEVTTRKIGEEIFARAQGASPSILSLERWQQYAMNWMTRDEDLKLRLFRFIEVLPALRTREAVASHMLEYLKRPRDGHPPLPLPLRMAVAFENPESGYAALVVQAARWGCRIMAGQFNAGSTPTEAIATVLAFRRLGMAFTLDVLGETIIADRIAREHQELYIRLIREIAEQARRWAPAPLLDETPWGRVPRVNISLKLSAIVTKFDPGDPAGTTQGVLDRLRPIMRAARDTGSFLTVDMEHYAVKDMTLDIYKRVLMEPEFREWPDCGIVIQVYMPDGERHMADLIDWSRKRGVPTTIRLVKGAYWDSETATAVRNGWPLPLYTRKWESDIAYEKVARMMLENADIIRSAFASHNVRSIAAVLAMEQALGLPPRTLEIQMLTGMGNPLKRALIDMKQRLRVYAPFGDQMTGMAYLIRRLIENTANESFLRQSFGQGTPVQTLLKNPIDHDHIPETPLPKPFIQDPDEYAEMNLFANEADVDFSRPEQRQAMDDALRSARAQFGRRYPAIIDNAPVETTEWFDSLNPSKPTEVVGRTAMCDAHVVDRAVAAARKALSQWAAAPAEQRAAVLERAADILHGRRFQAAAWLVFEVGKTWREAHGDIQEAIDYLRFYAYEARRLANRTRRRDYPGETNEYFYAPRGVVAVISPFCFPMALLTGMTAAAVVMGNAVLVKPAGSASVCGAHVASILIEAGLPRGVLNFVPGRGDQVGEHLVKHPGVDMIAFTGSRDIGCRIVENARHVRSGQTAFKHVVADMGAKNAIIIDDDADLDEAVQATIASAFHYSGQKCTACSRAIVLTSIYDDYLAKLVEAAAGIKPAASDLPGTTVGPLVDGDALERASQFIEAGKQHARCLLGGDQSRAQAGKTSTEPYFLSPVIFADVPPDSKLAQEEVLAPVLAVIRADSFEQAIDIANGTAYALTGGVFSRSPHNIELAKTRLEVGCLYVNRKITVSKVDRQPFGGFKMSGLGTKSGGPDYLQQFAIPRTISENTMRHGFSPATGTAKPADRPASPAPTRA